MGKKIRVYTCQHINMWKELNETGYYTMRRKYVSLDMIEHQKIMLRVYEWLARNMPNADKRPAPDALPVWVALTPSGAQAENPNVVTLELEIDEDMLTMINISKWGTIMNYSYIPKDDADAKRHQAKLREYGIDDTKAIMTPFYPMIKQEIEKSWSRLFDDSIILENGHECYAVIWEVRKEWVKSFKTGLPIDNMQKSDS